MILTIHIDNRAISLACYHKAKQIAASSLGTDLASTADQYACQLHQLLHFLGVDTDAVEGAVISSVVPALSQVLRQAVLRLDAGPVLMVEAGMKTGLNLRLDSAATVGSDFIACAVAALEEFPPPLIVIHMAGATTFTAIDEQGVLVGRSIMPGVEASLDCLCDSSAMLPKVSFAPKAQLIARGTADAIRSGALFGTASMVEGMLQRYRQILGPQTAAVATGELVPLISPHIKGALVYRPTLLHDGLFQLSRKNR